MPCDCLEHRRSAARQFGTEKASKGLDAYRRSGPGTTTRLLLASASHAGRWLALSVPRDRWYVRLMTTFENVMRGLRGNGFRTFVHSERAMDALLAGEGLEPVHQSGTWLWVATIYARRRCDSDADARAGDS